MNLYLVWFLCCVFSFGEELRVVRSIDLGHPEHEVFALAFSPDDHTLAVAFGLESPDKSHVVRLIVLDTASMHETFSVNISTDEIAKLGWSSDGKLILAQSIRGSWVVDPVSSGTNCEIGDSIYIYPGFLSRDSFVAGRASGDSTLLTFYNRACLRIGTATAPFVFGSADADSRNGLFAASHPGFGTEIFRTYPWTRIAMIPDFNGGSLVTLFGGATGFCVGKRMIVGDASLRCWSLTSTPAPIVSEFRAANAETKPVASARNAPLIAIQETALLLVSEKAAQRGKQTEEFRQWVIWDPLHGGTRGTVRGMTQSRRRPWLKRNQNVPYAAALSANGNLFAVAGNSRVDIYSTLRP